VDQLLFSRAIVKVICLILESPSAFCSNFGVMVCHFLRFSMICRKWSFDIQQLLFFIDPNIPGNSQPSHIDSMSFCGISPGLEWTPSH